MHVDASPLFGAKSGDMNRTPLRDATTPKALQVDRLAMDEDSHAPASPQARASAPAVPAASPLIEEESPALISLSPTPSPSPARELGSVLGFDTQPQCATQEAILQQLQTRPDTFHESSIGAQGSTSASGAVPLACGGGLGASATAEKDVFASANNRRFPDDPLEAGTFGSRVGSGSFSEAETGPLSTSSRVRKTGTEEHNGSPSPAPTRSPSVFTHDLSVTPSASGDDVHHGGGSSVDAGKERGSGGAANHAPLSAAEQRQQDLIATFRLMRQRREEEARRKEMAIHAIPKEEAMGSRLSDQDGVVGSFLQLLEWRDTFAAAEHGAFASQSASPSPLGVADTAIFLADPIRVTSSAVHLMLERVAADTAKAVRREEKRRASEEKERPRPTSLFGQHTHTDDGVPSSASHYGKDTPVALPRKQIPSELPSKLDMPLTDRCAFCQKHDSMCAKDHRRWNALKASYRERIAASLAYRSLSEIKRKALFFLTAAYGCGSFAAMQLLHEKGATSTMSAPFFFVHPPARDSARDKVARDRLVPAGRVHPFHVAAAFQNDTVLQTLADSPYTVLLPSSTHADALDWLGDAALRKLAVRPAIHTHLLHECITWKLRCGDGAGAKVLVDELAAASPMDVRTHWWHACRLLLQGRWEACVLECEALLNADADMSGTQALTPSMVQGLVSLAEAGQKGTAAKPSAINPVLLVSNTEVATGEAQETALAPSSTSVSGPSAPAKVSSSSSPTLGAPVAETLDRVPTVALTVPTASPHAHSQATFPLRRLPLRVIRAFILPFCDPESLWRLYSASAIPLLRRECEINARALPPAVFTSVLMRMPGFVSLLSTAATYQPNEDEWPLLELSPHHPVKPLGVLVVGVAGFHVMVIQVSATGRHAKPSGQADTPSRPKRTVAELLYEALVSSGDESGDDAERRGRDAATRQDGGDSTVSASLASTERPAAQQHGKAASSATVPCDATDVVVSRRFRIERRDAESAWEVQPVDQWAVDLPATEKLSDFLKSRRPMTSS